MARAADARRAEILKFWRTVEMFSPQNVPKAQRSETVYSVKPGEPLPWEPGHELARRRLPETQTWRHVVYLGIFRLDAVFEVLARVFTPDAESFDERPAGESALAAFLVSDDGCAVAGSEVLSSCAWATGRVLRPGRRGRDWLSGFDQAGDAFQESLRDLVTDDDTDANGSFMRTERLLDWKDLKECLDVAIEMAGTGNALPCDEIRISSQIVARRKAGTSGHEFLNSMIMDDLALVSDRARKGDIGEALREYLKPDAEISKTRRVDVRERLGDVLAATAPDGVPAGRWPASAKHPLALNQQLAVNTASRMPAILGVNGPPGTGKTTMLRDVIAAVVVERARQLAKLSSAAKAFSGEQLRWSTGQRTRVVSAWIPQLTGFEMVVASANNGAVENVTNEIPAADAVDESWRAEALEVGYFPEIATALLAPEPAAGKQAKGPDAWAMVAARLGNKNNRGRFVQSFWYDTPEKSDGAEGLLTILKGYEQSAPAQSWSAAVAEFRKADARAETIRAERSRIHQAIASKARYEEELADLVRAAANARQRVEAVRARLTEAEETVRAQQIEADQVIRARRAKAEQDAQKRRAEAERITRTWEAELGRRWQARAGHQAARPGLWRQLTTFGGAGRRWSHQDHWLAEEVAAAERSLGAARDARVEPTPTQTTYQPLENARAELARAQREIDVAIQAEADRDRAVRQHEAKLSEVHALLETASAELGRHFPDADWWQHRERRELAALWTDEEWNRARTALFLAALALHKAFLQHAPTEMRRNLQVVMDILGGDAPADLPDKAALAAWQTLFFVVPVVSTTFASFARLFSHLEKESLGWLFVDEAGQATPQNAVGALWRSKRAVIVGDPLQLEPVVTLPFRAEQALRGDLGVDEQWLTNRTSVQRLADRLTPLGTWLPDGDEKTWVGVPLTVHRRCDQPMFDIVNAVAYDGLMIDGTAPGPGEKFRTAYPTLPDSKWIDVAGTGSKGHWIPDEGKKLDQILTALAERGFDMSEVMVIAPFRSVAREVRDRTWRYKGLTAGTIHTAQGKQADIVILVLGSDPQRPGARKWAASTPNLLNVAVSRAKRRLYVIGNRTEWSKQRYFDVMARSL